MNTDEKPGVYKACRVCKQPLAMCACPAEVERLRRMYDAHRFELVKAAVTGMSHYQEMEDDDVKHLSRNAIRIADAVMAELEKNDD